MKRLTAIYRLRKVVRTIDAYSALILKIKNFKSRPLKKLKATLKKLKNILVRRKN